MTEPGAGAETESEAGTRRATIELDGTDTVVTVLEDAEAGDVVGDGGALELAESVPFGHKVALVDHEPGDEIRKYGEIIGVATEPIEPGEWVHTHNCDSARGKGGGTATSETETERTSEHRSRSESGTESEHAVREVVHESGRRGIRDRVLILPSVVCSHTVAERIADAVEGCVATPHDNGCGQIGRDNDLTERTLIAMGAHPNVAGAVVVGLGCEHVQSDAVAGALEDRDVPVRELSIQGVGGTEACVERGIEAAEALREGETVVGGTHSGGFDSDGAVETGTDCNPDTAIDLADLTIGIVSTDLEDPTVETADPLVGGFADRVLAAGGRVVVAGTERVSAHPEAARERIDADLDDLLAAARSGPARAPRVRRRAGDRSFEATTRAWGVAPVDELLEYGESPRADTGLALVDSSSRFEEAATALVAAGAQLVVHVTGDGIPTGHPIAPVVKVSATASTLEAVGADIDVDARTATVDDLATYVRSVADGTPCRADVHGVTSFAIERAGPSM